MLVSLDINITRTDYFMFVLFQKLVWYMETYIAGVLKSGVLFTEENLGLGVLMLQIPFFPSVITFPGGGVFLSTSLYLKWNRVQRCIMKSRPYYKETSVICQILLCYIRDRMQHDLPEHICWRSLYAKWADIVTSQSHESFDA